MLLYILVFIAALLIAFAYGFYSKSKYRSPKVVIPIALTAALPTILLLGLRVDVGTDYSSYVRIWNEFVASASYWHQEPLFSSLNKFSISIMREPWLMFMLAGTLSTSFVYYRIFSSSPLPWLSFVILFGMGFIFMQTNHVRSTIAASIMLFSVPWIWKEKKIHWIMASIVAWGFHYTALFMTPMYWILRKKWPLLVAYIMFSIALIISLSETAGSMLWDLARYVLPDRYSPYPDLVEKLSGSYEYDLDLFAHIGMAVVLLLLWNRSAEYDKNYRVVQNGFFVGVVMVLGLQQFWAVWRISVYLLLIGVLFWPYLVMKLRSRLEKYIAVYVIALYYISLFGIGLMKSSHDALPYRSVFTN